MTAALALARRWVNDYFNRHDADAARDFCSPDYVLEIGDVTLAGRDDTWLPAVDRQMRDYPGLTMTVHETLAGEGWTAVWFSEHGARDGAAAVWSGVAIYREDHGLLSGCVAQEDYMTRRRQLKERRGDPVDRPQHSAGGGRSGQGAAHRLGIGVVVLDQDHRQPRMLDRQHAHAATCVVPAPDLGQ